MNDYIWYCQAGLDFYDRPSKTGGQTFALVESRPPDGWEVASDDSWTTFHPKGSELAEQGWKVHVSAVSEDAEKTMDIVAAYCFAQRTPFKVLTRPKVYLRMNSKYAPRGGSGKLITLYPPTTTALRRTLDELEVALKGRPGPYVLSDLRWRDGPLYVRYGGFRKMHTSDDRGRRVLAVRAPDGGLVPDVRGPSFRPPSWVEIPGFLAEQRRAVAAGSGESLPYSVQKALHFSNGGGIYLAADPDTDQPVVLREARPYAGLDGAGNDAVARLYREAQTLRDLGDLDFVPTLKETFTCWEHHFLAQEFIEGETLWDFMAANNPATSGTAGQEDFAAYARTASDLLGQIEEAVTAVNARGYVFGDLHPRNVMVRPDGRIALVDFEVAYRPGEAAEPALACPGFVAEHAAAGKARDTYALDCLRVAVFLPLTQMLDLDAGKARDLPEAVAELFPAADQMSGDLVDRLRPRAARDAAGPRPGAAFAAAARNPGGPPLRTLRDAMVRGITASATPERADRLFPGDPKALDDGGHTLAHGAAGVLYALHTVGEPLEDSHVEWLATATRRAPARAGLWDGLHGAALVLHALGREREAYDALERSAPQVGRTTSAGLYEGLAGIGLTLRHVALSTGDSHWQAALETVADRLADTVNARHRQGAPTQSGGARAGLMYGLTGAALFFLRRYEDTLDGACLDLAVRALGLDLEHCRTDENGQVTLAQGPRLLPYLGTGSGGLAEAVALCHRHRPDERLASWHEGVLRACRAPFTIEANLLGGRAGLMAVLAGHATRAHAPGAPDALPDHVRRLAWHAVPRGGAPDEAGTLAFPGHALLRLSMDLASGTAGVLLALHGCARAAAAQPGVTGGAGEARTWAEATGLPVPGPATC
ncbi:MULTISPECIES: class III lanthionine synthetase LanKC [Streptomyces]|uniref:class III lanthionine synthetase LanKC n=1 Tax=Streptomyces lycopersici TaxID=2974589 RepID=UPI0021D14E4E|nr:class III lanthionine synthetase LanKC [Streptomyces sp. NEAU-383]